MDSRLRGDRVIKFRKERGMTQYDLADALGIAQNQVSRYERAIVDLPTPVLDDLANLFDTTTDYLLGRSNIPHPGAEPDPYADFTSVEIEILRLLRSYPPDDQKRLLQALTTLRSIGGTDADS